MTFIYEMVGRRIPIWYSMLATNALIFMMPRVAPDFTVLLILRAIVGLNNTLIVAAPLISDYVKLESRGRAVAINTLFIGLSQIFATQLLVPMTQSMNFNQAFTFSSALMMAITIPVLLMIREPSKKLTKKSPSQEDIDDFSRVSVNNNENNNDIDNFHGSTSAEAASTTNVNAGEPERVNHCTTTIKEVSAQLYQLVCSDPKWFFIFIAAS